LDTRTKIAQTDTAKNAHTIVVSGYFDPLTAAHARRLTELRSRAGRLVAVVLDPPEPVLAARDRAELVAALACVDQVILGASEEIDVHEEQADLERRAALIAAVQARCAPPCRA
jgi:glycerol-3-phosphate cytidylyltransferase-like family protein